MTPPPSEGGGAANPFVQFLPLILIGVVFYFMILRPNKKRQKERQEQLAKVEKGDKVIMSNGMHGTISAIEDTTVLVQVSDNTKIRFEKAAITTLVDKK